MALSKRKPCNRRAQVERSLRSLMRTSHVAVVNVDPEGRQGLINWKNCKNINLGRQIISAVHDIAHPWVIYISALCVDQAGNRYTRSVEVVPKGIYRAEHLSEVIRVHYSDLRDSCNPAHLVASAWIALPGGESLTETEADRVYTAVAAWPQSKRAA